MGVSLSKCPLTLMLRGDHVNHDYIAQTGQGTDFILEVQGGFRQIKETKRS